MKCGGEQNAGDPEFHSNYEALVAKAVVCHEKGRTSAGITPNDVTLARLYCYAFRLHTIGAFHATRVALTASPSSTELAKAWRSNAVETLQDLANQGMEPVPDDFRALLSTFYRYHRGVCRVMNALTEEVRSGASGGAGELPEIRKRFVAAIGQITRGNGIHLTQDTHAPNQASFIVPSLGITIVPLVYGDHHSWNLAYLGGARSDVPYHRHHEGVEIHLGYGPLRGFTVLGDYAAEVVEGYAMPIPPMTRHGFTNASEDSHHVPFIFGSLKHGGWGVFLDVEPQPAAMEDLRKVDRDAPQFRQTIHLERQIAAAERTAVSRRWTLIPASATDRDGSGGLELSIARVTERGLTLSAKEFLAVSIVAGKGTVDMAGVSVNLAKHDHFGLPAGVTATLRQSGSVPLVLLTAAIRRRF